MKNKIKIILTTLITIAFLSGCGIAQRSEEKKQSQERYKIAKAMFDERCKKSGVFIHKTVKDVDGIFLMKVRPKEINFGNQYKLDDPYGEDVGGDNYIKILLQSYHFYLREDRARKNMLTNRKSSIVEDDYKKGYSFVEAVDERNGKRYRYSGSEQVISQADIKAPAVILNLKNNPNYDINNYGYVLEKKVSNKNRPRYGITYDDISTKTERDYWIAGSSLKVVDLQINETIAERIGYMMDYGQGSSQGGRSPWLFAADMACPSFKITNKDRASIRQLGQTHRFLEKVLIPKLNSRTGE